MPREHFASIPRRLPSARLAKAACIAGLISIGIGFSTVSRSSTIATTPVSRLEQAWWKARFIEKQAELRRKPVNLLWLGDSITQNWELAGPETWRRFAPIWQRYYGDRHAVDLGFKGDSTCHLLWRLQHGELDNLSPRGAILLIGANNFGHIHTNAEQTYAGIQAVLNEIHQRLPLTHILVLGVLPSIRSRWVTDNTHLLNGRLQREVSIGRPYVSYADVGSLFITNGTVAADKFLDHYLSPPDPPLHPTAEVQGRIAALIEPKVAEMLGDRLHQ